MLVVCALRLIGLVVLLLAGCGCSLVGFGLGAASPKTRDISMENIDRTSPGTPLQLRKEEETVD
jgi:hypothetical protein